jgi:hypothetical protein
MRRKKSRGDKSKQDREKESARERKKENCGGRRKKKGMKEKILDVQESE